LGKKRLCDLAVFPKTGNMETDQVNTNNAMVADSETVLENAVSMAVRKKPLTVGCIET
jgi:hypothetical protein